MKNRVRMPKSIQTEAALTLPHFGSVSKLFLFPLAVLSSGTGLTLGVLYLGQKDSVARRFGAICLILGMLGLLLRLWKSAHIGGVQGGDSLTQPFY